MDLPSQKPVMKKALVLLNQHTIKQRLRSSVLQILDLVTKAGYECLVRPTQSRGDATENVISHADVDLIVCVGGDGTLLEVTSGLLRLPYEKRPPISYLPAGTTNDFAGSLRISPNPEKTLALLSSGEPKPVDCAFFGKQVFNYVASFGAFTEASYRTPQQFKNLFGHVAYLVDGMLNPGIKPHHLSVNLDGQTVEDDFVFGAFSNSLSMGGALKLPSSQVNFNDGRHEYLLIRMPENPAKLGEIALALTSRSFLNPATQNEHILFGHFSSAEVLCENTDWSLDGEYAHVEKTVSISVQKSAYRLYY